MFISAHASTFIKADHIQVRSGFDSDYYPSQWVIWVSDADLVSTLVVTIALASLHTITIQIKPYQF